MTDLRKFFRLESILKAILNPRRAYHIIKQTFDRQPYDKARQLQENITDPSDEFLTQLTDLIETEPDALRLYLEEPSSKIGLEDHIHDCQAAFEKKPFQMGGMDVEGAVMYACLRALKPDTVVEVGVANGVSSAYILSALDENGGGELFSIDQPMYESEHEGEWKDTAGGWIPQGKDVGWVVPEHLHSRWDLRTGDVFDILPAELNSGLAFDALVYDGPKLYPDRMKLLQLARRHALDDALFICDDLAWNSSLHDFCNKFEDESVDFGNVGFSVIKK